MTNSLNTDAARVQGLLDGGDLIGASRLLAGTFDCHNPQMLALTSQLLRLRGRMDEALVYAEQALQVDSKSVPALIEAARSYVDRGDVERAQEAYEKAYRVEKAAQPWFIEWAELLCSRGKVIMS